MLYECLLQGICHLYVMPANYFSLTNMLQIHHFTDHIQMFEEILYPGCGEKDEDLREQKLFTLYRSLVLAYVIIFVIVTIILPVVLN